MTVREPRLTDRPPLPFSGRRGRPLAQRERFHMTETESTTTTHEFQAAVSQVLRLVINSLYSNPEIFLRELVSNASDALDKLRFAGISDPALLEGEELHVRLAFDREKKTLIVSDSGIGMSREELVTNLGTVAHSGSAELMKRLSEMDEKKADLSLIGQFGVGFYSAYLVADRVEVVSRAAGASEAHVFSSDGKSTFTIGPATREGRGTDLVLHLREDHLDLLDEHRLRALVRRYSDYVAHPIELEVEVPADEAAGTPAAKRFERINSGNALWRRSAKDVEPAQYEELYTHLTHDWEKPLAHKHFQVEGTQLFYGLLFLPKRPPFDLFSADVSHGVRLHVKRVFIMDDCEELLPRFLRFVRGVIDSEDLPLNVSREILQDSRVVKTMRKQVVKRALDMIEELAAGESYAEWWSGFGAVLKEGLHFESDPKDRERIAKLLRYESSRDEGLVSLETYVKRMPLAQKAIYYVLGASKALVQNTPHLEVLRKKGYEVLYMTDPVDAFAVEGLREFDGKPLVSAMDADLTLDGDAEAATARKEDDAKRFGPLLARFREVLGEKVSEVRLSDRLTDSAVCLVQPKGGLPPYLARILRAQHADLPPDRRALELNPAHPLVESIAALHARAPEDAQLTEWIEVLYDQALLAEGSPIDDPARLVRRMTALLADAAARAAGAAE